jgi:hypothetical protein
VRTWKEAFISCFKAVFWHLLWEAEEKETTARTSVRIACNVAKILTVNLLYTGVGATAISACSVMNQIQFLLLLLLLQLSSRSSRASEQPNGLLIIHQANHACGHTHSKHNAQLLV